MLGFKHILTLSLLFLLCLFRLEAIAQSPDELVLTDDQDRYSLGLHLEILEDIDGNWTIEDVTSLELAQQFVSSQTEIPNYGFTDSAFWVRFRAKDLSEFPVRWLLAVESNTFFIDVYVPGEIPGQYQVTKTGMFLPFDTRDVEHPKFLFNLPLTSEEETIFLRLESEASMNFPLTIWSAEAVSQDDLAQQVLNGFIYGVLLIMIGYNLILFVYLRDRSYFYYFLFLFFLLMAFMVDDGFAHQYLWPNQGRINAIGGQLSFVLVNISALLFTTSFLPIKETAPRLRMAINIVLITYLLLLPVQFIDIGLAARPLLILTVTSYILIVIAGIVSWRRGYRPARYFMLAWLLLLTSMLTYTISLFDFLPLSLFSVLGSQIGIVVLTLTLSLALADRISSYRQERDSAQQEMMRKQEEFANSLQQANVELEAKFGERTQELDFAHEQLDSLFRNSTLAIGTADMDGRVLTANDSLKNILGYANDEIYEANVSDFFVDKAFRLKVIEKLNSERFARFPMVQLRRKDGTIFYANLTESIMSRKDQNVLLGIVDDITDQVLAEQEQQRLAEEAAVAEERNRIARELHDSVTQSLYSASLIAEAVPKFWNEHPDEAEQDLKELHMLTQGAQAEMRTLLLELRPDELVDHKLSELLRQLVDAMSGRTDLPITLTVTGECILPPDVQIAFYRITQEALNNISKHARATRARVILVCDQDQVILRVVDDGRGFDLEKRLINQLGLNIMRERAEAIGAELSIESEIGQGTEVRVVWQAAA
jgi:PAS domain S-box-containing protein